MFSPSLSGEAAGLGTPTHPLPTSSPPPSRGKLGLGSVWTNPRLQFAGEKNSCPISKRWGLQNSVGEGRKTPEEGQRAGTGTGRDWDTQRREMRDTGNRRVRARNLEPTETRDISPLDQGPGGNGRATLAGRAGALARGSLGPETQSQLRKGRGGERGAGLEARWPLAARCGGPDRSLRGRTGRGLGGGGPSACSTPQRPARGNLT